MLNDYSLNIVRWIENVQTARKILWINEFVVKIHNRLLQYILSITCTLIQSSSVSLPHNMYWRLAGLAWYQTPDYIIPFYARLCTYHILYALRWTSAYLNLSQKSNIDNFLAQLWLFTKRQVLIKCLSAQ